MRSFRRLGALALASPLLADDVVEFHAARLLLLIATCGIKGRITGLTKLAKLDFFVRYPQFFDEACRKTMAGVGSAARGVESSMIRFKYGPWDHRYYQVLPYLEGLGLISVEESEKSIELSITSEGQRIAALLAQQSAFAELVDQIRRVGGVFGRKSGSSLKKLIYKLFQNEVVNRQFGEVIY